MKLKRHRKLAMVMAVVMVLSVAFMAACSSPEPAPAADPAPAPATTDAPAPPPADDTTYIMRIGCGAGGGNPQIKFMDELKILVEDMSDGRLVIENYPSSQFGTMAQMLQGIQDGSLGAMLAPSNYYSAVVPEMVVLDIPGIFDDTAHLARTFMNNPSPFDDALAAAGLIPMEWLYLNDMMLIGNKNITSIGDLRGLKVWCNPGVVVQMNLEVLGLSPSLLDTGELVSAMQSGTIDMAFAGAPLFFPFGFADIADYLMLYPRMPATATFMVSQAWMDTIPADLQGILRDAAAIVNNEVVYEYGIGFQQTCIDGLTDGGVTALEVVGTPLQAEIDAAMATVGPDYLAQFPDHQWAYDAVVALAATSR